MRSVFFLACVTACALGSVVACSSPTEEATHDSDLINGDIAADDAFPSTMQVVGNCTVTKIGERLILTAAHCVRTENGALRGEFEAGRSLNLVVRGPAPGARTATIARTVLHPQIEHLCRTKGCRGRASDERRDAPDVAVIEVEGAALEGIPIAEVDVEETVPGDEVTILGYGCVGSVWGSADGKLRYLDTRIVDVSASIHEGGLTAGDDEGLGNIRGSYNVTPGPTPLPQAASAADGGAARADGAAADGGAVALDGGAPTGNGTGTAASPERSAGLCPGDSGGALYRKGTNRVVGVNASYTFLPRGDVPVTNWHARVDAQSRWGVAEFLEALGAKMTRACAESSCNPSRSASSATDGGAGDASSDAAGDGG